MRLQCRATGKSKRIPSSVSIPNRDLMRLQFGIGNYSRNVSIVSIPNRDLMRLQWFADVARRIVDGFNP